MQVLKSWYHGLMLLCVNLSNLVPKGYQCKLFEVGPRAFYGAMGTFVEGCQNRKKNDDYSGKNEK